MSYAQVEKQSAINKAEKELLFLKQLNPDNNESARSQRVEKEIRFLNHLNDQKHKTDASIFDQSQPSLV